MSQADIALFLPSLRGGGAERVMMNLAKGFAERGRRVDLVLVRGEGPYRSQVFHKVRVVDLRVKRVLYSLPRLVHYLRNEQPKTLLATLSDANVVAIWAKLLSGTNVRLVVRETTTVRINARNAPLLRARWIPLFVKFFYRYADAIVANSWGAAEDLQEFIKVPLEKIKVIYNPVVTSDLWRKAEEPLRHSWFRIGEPPVILGVGRLTRAKDFPTLIRAFSLVRRQQRSRLMILGEGEDRQKLVALIQQMGLVNDATLPGFVENPYRYMKRAAVFVLPSRWEGLPNALIEALALGVPVVSTDCPSGPREILENGRCGRLVPVGAVEELARAILAQLKAPLPPCPLEALKAKYGVREVVDQYLNVLGISD